MNKAVLKITIAIFAFTIGVSITAIWFIKPFPHETLKDIPVVQDETGFDEQYAVYSVLINDMFSKRFSSKDSLTISSKTYAYSETIEALDYLKQHSFEQRVDRIQKYHPSVPREVLEDFEAKIMKPITLEKKFNIPVQYHFIDEKQAEKNDGRAAVKLIRLSPVGFNKERTQAFVSIDYFCPLCGFGTNVYLEKQNGDWKIKEEFNNWVS